MPVSGAPAARPSLLVLSCARKHREPQEAVSTSEARMEAVSTGEARMKAAMSTSEVRMEAEVSTGDVRKERGV